MWGGSSERGVLLPKPDRVGLSYDGKLITGWAAMAHDVDERARLIEDLQRTHGIGVAL
jgi:hypothetical protein